MIQKPIRELIFAVESAHETHYEAVVQELEMASGLLCDPSEGNRILACIRAYRALDWYQSQLRSAIVEGLALPFRHLFVKEIKPRAFFRDVVLESVQVGVLQEAFRHDVMGLFFKTHAALRNQISHGLRVPTLDESRALVGDALEVFNRADASMHFPTPRTALNLPLLTQTGSGESEEPPA